MQRILKKITLLHWLIASTALIYFLVAMRVWHSGTLKHFYLLWNLILASVPMLIIELVKMLKIRVFSAWFYVFGVFWLLFLPNAPYIITDLVHLHYDAHVPFWYDAAILFSAAFIGLLWGIVSFFELQHYIETRSTRRFNLLMVTSIFTMVSYGVYVGRYLRWNSWDAITRPLQFVQSLYSTATIGTLYFIILFTIIQMFIYLFILTVQKNTNYSVAK